jgi:NADH-quinone oxidoreductase subunit J
MVIDLVFFTSVAILMISAMGVITSNNPVHSALFLVSCFFQSSVLWLLLEAEFLAIALIVIYVGAVMVLFLYVVMMLDIRKNEHKQSVSSILPIGIGISILFIAELIFALSGTNVVQTRDTGVLSNPNNTEALGIELYTNYLVEFELASIILLLGIIAAISLTLHRRPGLKKQDISQQVSVSKKDRLKVVQVRSGEGV